MAALNPLTSELVFKIVFYGPGLGGKTTTLQHVYGASKPENRGSMVSLATDTERTLYFDFLPLQVLKIRNLSVRLQLFTVPGQVHYGATRKLVLNGCDGVVFVADSQAARLEANQESLDDLNANLLEQGLALSRVPHQFHWNKRDLPDVVPVTELDRRLNLFSAPSIETVATTGEGVFRGLELITRAVFHAYKAELPEGKKGAKPPVFLDAEEVGLTDALRDLADSRPVSRPAMSARTSTPETHARATAPLPRPHVDTTRSAAKIETMHIAQAPPMATMHVAQAPTIAPVTAASFSLADLWPENERDGVRRAEALIGARDATSAVIACDVLLTRILDAVAPLVDDGARDAATRALLLGVDGARYVAFRIVAKAAKERRDVNVRDALECYTVVLDARRGLTRV